MLCRWRWGSLDWSALVVGPAPPSSFIGVELRWIRFVVWYLVCVADSHMEKSMKFGALYKYKAHCVPWFLKVTVVIETGLVSFTLPSTRQILRWKLAIKCSSISKSYCSKFFVASEIVQSVTQSYTFRYLCYYIGTEYRWYTGTIGGIVDIYAVDKWSMETSTVASTDNMILR